MVILNNFRGHIVWKYVALWSVNFLWTGHIIRPLRVIYVDLIVSQLLLLLLGFSYKFLFILFFKVFTLFIIIEICLSQYIIIRRLWNIDSFTNVILWKTVILNTITHMNFFTTIIIHIFDSKIYKLIIILFF